MFVAACVYVLYWTIDAQAYASYMKGTLLFEQDQNWETALVNFKNARYMSEHAYFIYILFFFMEFVYILRHPLF